MRNELAGDISLAAGKSQYDAQCKRVLANRVILAWILEYTVKEFENMSIPQIKKCIGNDIQISKIRVSPGRTNAPQPEKIIGEDGADKVPGEGEIYFDIRFSVFLPKKREKVKMIINVEAQKDFYPGYAIPGRGVYYGARMISAQKGTEFSGSNYDGIKKVYSIWICMNAPDHIGNAISEYSITKRDKIPGIPDVKAAYDKLSVVMICLNPRTGKGNRLTQMLNILLSPEIKPERKIRKLEEEFHIPMEDGMGKELNQMCNLSDLVEEKGIQRGIQRGRKELLVEMIEKKLKKGKSIHRIADELEEDESVIRSMVEKIQKKEKGKIEDEQI